MYFFEPAFRIPLTLLLLVLIVPVTRGYQLADGTPPAPDPPVKYIFYWGGIQADLTAENNFESTHQLTPAQFRQMLHHQPFLWTGNAMAPKVSFRLEGQPVTATRGTDDYLTQIGPLDEKFGQAAAAGKALHLSGLQLEGQTTGRITFLLIASEEDAVSAGGSTPARGSRRKASRNATYSYAGSTNTQLVKKVIWGREDIYDNANRDYFSATEFWQTVRQLPYIEWQPYTESGPVKAGVQFQDVGQTTLSLTARVEPDLYRGMTDNLQHYRHLVKPGAIISLTLHTVEQHDNLYVKTMTIVPDNDPRLALRRDRDTHTLWVRWGSWEESVPNLYLLELKDDTGTSIPVDPPLDLRRFLSNNEAPGMLATRPEFRIDGYPVPDMTFQLHTPYRTVTVTPDQPMPAALPDSVDLEATEQLMFRIDSLQAPGYHLPLLSLSMGFITVSDPLRVRNQLPSLLAAPGSVRIKLRAPVQIGKTISVEFELPERAKAALSIFDQDGWNHHTLDTDFPSGKNQAVLTPKVALQPGTYFLFLNTIFGVARQEFLVN
ncbi:MAG: hypothetical protein EP344_14305 [Bacteroidetes bacterium]|nr:MAG: hypothetical protein EP344_14305 [Bacteroidota bacterium]